MTENFLLYFASTDLRPAAEEMLRLYRPDAACAVLSEADYRSRDKQPAAGEILLAGAVETEGETIFCKASLSCLRCGQPVGVQQERQVEILPWEDEKGAQRRVMRLLINALLKDYYREEASPWGILRGVRPTKLVHRLFDMGRREGEIRGFLGKAYGVTESKADLITDIARRQRPFLPTPPEARRLVSVYVGIPFCPSRCIYCSFPSYPVQGAGRMVHEFLDALRREIAAVQDFFARHGLHTQTIYIGGGTPTSLPDKEFGRLLQDVSQAFRGPGLREFSVEAGRPDTITPDKLVLMREAGVDRISINPQSMREHTLRAIGRSHRPEQVEQVFALARETGFDNINMDLIAGLPGETLDDIRYTLQRISQLRPENLTVHTLAVKRGSNLKEYGSLSLPSARIVRDMLEVCASAARGWGLAPYYLYRQKYMAGNLENIGYALPGKECLYNIQIMEEHQSIAGLGAAAATKAVDPRTWSLASCYNPKDVPTYINDLQRYLTRKLTLMQRVFANEEELLC